MALFQKGGGDSVDIAGRKIPIAAIAGVIALIGVLLFMRARGQSAQVGQAPAGNTGANPVIDYTGANAGATADSAALANLSQQLAGLNQSINSQQPSAPPAATGPGTFGAVGKTGYVYQGGQQYAVYNAPASASAADVATHFWGSPNAGLLQAVGYEQSIGNEVQWLVPTSGGLGATRYQGNPVLLS